MNWTKAVKLGALTCAVLAFLGSAHAAAATIVVDGVVCTLGEAIVAANTNRAFGGCPAGNDRGGGDVIDLRSDVVLTSWDNVDADGCRNGLPAITSEITIRGNRRTISRSADDGTPGFRILDSRGGTLTLERVNISNGVTEYCDGGGIKGSTITLIDSTVSSNIAYLGNGAGVAGTFVTLLRSRVSDNLGEGLFVNGTAIIWESEILGNVGYTEYTGGGADVRGLAVVGYSTIADNIGGGAWAIGGGLYVDGEAYVSNSTLSGNVALGDVGLGGGIFLYRGSLTVVNSTLSGNVAGSHGGVSYGGSGGGIFSSGLDSPRTGPGGRVFVIQSTIVNNRADGDYVPPYFVGGRGGGIMADNLVLTNSIIAGNAAANTEERDCSGSKVDFRGINFIGDGSCNGASSLQLTGDPMLGALSDNGGNTRTHMPLPGSAVIDRIPALLGVCLYSRVTTDQRDVRRQQSLVAGACDIGAVEYTRRKRGFEDD